MTDSNVSRKAIGLVVVVFLLGIALGGVGTHLWDAHMLASQRHHSMVRELKEQLQLTPAQAAQYDALVSEARSKFHALDAQEHAEWYPKDDQVRQEWREKTRGILTADQKNTFDAFVKKLDEERQKEQHQGH
ncbi:MAG TPA: hypothetical protein VGU63_10700 [Candidatus Acidoferrales bacterium]|nr:hypothetical protein [Candidatus Acidoferrales bacterium]